MFNLNRHVILMASAVTLILAMVVPLTIAADVPLMTKETLSEYIEKGDVVVLDVRQGRDWNSSEFKIQGAQRVDTKNISAWAEKSDKTKTTVLYCA